MMSPWQIIPDTDTSLNPTTFDEESDGSNPTLLEVGHDLGGHFLEIVGHWGTIVLSNLLGATGWRSLSVVGITFVALTWIVVAYLPEDDRLPIASALVETFKLVVPQSAATLFGTLLSVGHQLLLFDPGAHCCTRGQRDSWIPGAHEGPWRGSGTPPKGLG